MITISDKLPRDEAPHGFYKITDDEYFESPGISSSDLSLFLRSPAHFESVKMRDHERTPSESMVLGQAFHTFMLEPHLFDSRFYIMRDDIKRNTREGKFRYNEAVTQSRGRSMIKNHDMQRLREMKASIMGYRDNEGRKVAHDLLSPDGGYAELAMYWQDPVTHRVLRGKTDMIRQGGVIVDVKTTQDASFYGFQKSVAKFGYHRQAAMYCWGAGELLGKPIKAFYFIAVESEPPHITSIFRCSPSMLDQGMREIRRALDKLDSCMVKNKFLGYQENGPEELTMPSWAVDKEDQL